MSIQEFKENRLFPKSTCSGVPAAKLLFSQFGPVYGDVHDTPLTLPWVQTPTTLTYVPATSALGARGISLAARQVLL